MSLFLTSDDVVHRGQRHRPIHSNPCTFALCPSSSALNITSRLHSSNHLSILNPNLHCVYCDSMLVFRPRRSRSAEAYSRQTFPWTICRSVRTCVGRSVCPVHCGKTADRIRMPFGIIGRMGPGMRQVVGFGDLSTGRCTSVSYTHLTLPTNREV